MQEHSNPAMISRTLVWHHSHYLEVPLSARAQVAAGDTAFVMAIHGATLVSIPHVLADVDPTSIWIR